MSLTQQEGGLYAPDAEPLWNPFLTLQAAVLRAL